jgi:serine/threonine protein kinase
MPTAGDTVGGLRIERLLGEGAGGAVFVAADEKQRRMALKVLRPGAVRSRLVREARLARSVASRHVAPILDVGRWQGLDYLVLPYFEGGSLAAHLAAVRRLSVAGAVALAAQLGRGLDDLHDAGILHRDVKPSNVLLDGRGEAVLADFGLARAGDSTRLTEEGQLLGTAYYLAPELIEGQEATRASDIYALGCVLYECVVGAPPFAGGPALVGYAHLAEEPPDPRERRPELAGDVAEALLIALSKQPGSRPTTATALARLLHAAHSASPA